jgi:nitrate/nitrite-specific signal transduction histidine kinase
VRVHPELLKRQKLPPGNRGQAFWDDRYQDINNFERHLDRNGTLVVKFFLNVSKAEQKRRFLERDSKLLMRLAHHVVVSIENAQLYRQLRYLAALDERNQLAREMRPPGLDIAI